ncbi:MAG: hypothetical protein PHP00_07730 [Thiotrichaceae bacterium]|nr:hypothetical protein [Thiotrichaceae bacterium]
MWKGWLGLMIGYCCCSNVLAVQHATLALGMIDGKAWQAEGVSLQLQLTEPLAMKLEIASLHLPSLPQALHKVEITCPHIEYRADLIACAKAQLSLPALSKTVADLSFQYHPATQKIQLKLQSWAVAGGTLAGEVESAGEQIQVDLQASQLNLASLLKNLEIPPETAMNLAGIAQFKVKATMGGQHSQVQVDGQTTRLYFSSADASHAGEQLNLAFNIKAKQNQDAWQINSDLKLLAGEILSQPLYIKLEKNKPIEASLAANYQDNALHLQNFQYHHADILNLGAQGKFKFSTPFTVENLRVMLPKTLLQPVYKAYLQEGAEKESALSSLQLRGDIALQLDWDQEQGTFRSQLHDIHVEDTNKRFAFHGLDGELIWGSEKADAPSYLNWQAGFIAKHIPLGASGLKAVLQGHSIRLLGALNQPVLDGAFQIDKLHLHDVGLETMHGDFSANLQPISLPALCTALDFPKLNGQLSGSIPSVRYHQDGIDLGGALTVQAFDGEMIIRTLHIDKLSSRSPILSADIAVKQFDLATLTQVTEFGEIQGRLSGKIQGLKMVNWQPIAFNALLITPKDDDSTHLISQKAVNNLTSLGGNGAINALSRGVLSFFENFSYERLGWGCRLENGVCEMRGVEDAPNGYYIVKGGGLPRIDVIGYNKRVNWDVLLNRLKAVTKLQKPIIK